MGISFFADMMNLAFAERYRIMCRYYGALPTQMRHLWFATRFLWAKVSGNKA